MRRDGLSLAGSAGTAFALMATTLLITTAMVIFPVETRAQEIAPPDSLSTAEGLRAPTSSLVRPPSPRLAYPEVPGTVSLSYPRPPARRYDLWTPRIEVLERNRFQTTVAGADRGAYLGMATGFVGSTLLGLWDEKTAMHLVAAGAALGALWGGTVGSDQLHFNVRYRDD